MKRLPPLVVKAARAALEKKAEAALALDLRKVADFTDFFLLLTGHNQRQLVAIADAVTEALRAEGRRPEHGEGYPRHEWILLDYGGFVVHVMTPKSRSFYDLERIQAAANQAAAHRADDRPSKSERMKGGN